MTAVTGGVALVRHLVEEGVDTLFTVPGVQLDWVFDALRTEGNPIRAIVPRHEQATTYMADGYARTTGRIGAAMVVPGPGVLNAAAGLATAYACNSRVLMIAGQIRSSAVGRELGLLHEIKDQTSVLRSVTKASLSVGSRDALSPTLHEAFAALRTGRPRPVSVEIPHDLLSAEGEAGGHGKSSADQEGTHELPSADIRKAAELLSNARFPVIFSGGGVIAGDAGAELAALAQALGAPVVMNENGRGALSDRHPLALSILGGQKAFQQADVVLVVGSRFIDTLSAAPLWPMGSARFVGLNTNSADLGAPRAYEVALCADAKAGLAALTDAVRPRRDDDARQAVAQIRTWQAEQLATLQPLSDYVAALRRALPEDGILVNELTQVGYLSRVAFPVYRPRTLISPGYQGTLGYGFSTALGAAIGRPDARVISIMGDGGFGWTMQELATAVRYAVPVTLVLFNDGHFGNVRALQTAQFGIATETELRNPDFGKLAEAFGMPATRVSTPDALEAELARAPTTGPSLIEVTVGQMPSPWRTMRLQTT